MNEKKIRKAIKKYLFECACNGMMDEEVLDEERITNDDASKKVSAKENFIGSHCWGEQLGNSGDYVACSYGKHFPVYIFDADEKKWFSNADDYVFEGEVVEQTQEHKKMLRPETVDVHMQSLDWMLNKLHSLMKKNGIKELSHLSVQPGTKN